MEEFLIIYQQLFLFDNEAMHIKKINCSLVENF